jgi:hypothetical protein
VENDLRASPGAVALAGLLGICSEPWREPWPPSWDIEPARDPWAACRVPQHTAARAARVIGTRPCGLCPCGDLSLLASSAGIWYSAGVVGAMRRPGGLRSSACHRGPDALPAAFPPLVLGMVLARGPRCVVALSRPRVSWTSRSTLAQRLGNHRACVRRGSLAVFGEPCVVGSIVIDDAWQLPRTYGTRGERSGSSPPTVAACGRLIVSSESLCQTGAHVRSRAWIRRILARHSRHISAAGDVHRSIGNPPSARD